MSEPTTEEVGAKPQDLDAEDTEEPDSSETETDDELPDEGIVDVSSIAESVEGETTPDTETDAEEADPDESDPSPDDSSDPIETGDRVTAGKIYTNGLGVLGASMRARYGSLGGDEDRSELADEYAELARDLEIDKAVDQYLAEQGGIDSLSPGQTITASTLLWCGMIGMEDPELVDGLLDDMGGDS